MPDFPIIDAHVHLWDPEHFRMAWIKGDATLDQAYTPAEYRKHTQGVEVEALVYVEVDVDAPFALLEADWVAEWAQKDPLIQGVVAFAPLEYGEQVRPYLRALLQTAAPIKGIRRNLQSITDPAFYLSSDFIRGVQMLSTYGLSFDICVKHWQLESIVELVHLCPDTAFILDHLGKPAIEAQSFEPWRTQIQALAAYPHVLCKVSGMVTEADLQGWSPEDLAPYLTCVLEAFGEDRVVFGGDWPVILHASSYTRWVETLDTLTAHLTPVARRKLWAENARRFYRLKTL